jgi:hypothetical protein
MELKQNETVIVRKDTNVTAKERGLIVYLQNAKYVLRAERYYRDSGLARW